MNIDNTGMDVGTKKELEPIVREVIAEFAKAMAKFGSFNSDHEGYAVLKEEVDELWDEIKRDNPTKAREEAIQVAAMGLRFIFDSDNRQLDTRQWAMETRGKIL